MKEMYPYRVNAVACMKHKIFRPDPEELKRRRKLRKKKLQEMEQENCESEAEETNNAQNVILYIEEICMCVCVCLPSLPRPMDWFKSNLV